MKLQKKNIKFFLNAGADPNIQDSNGDTALICAAQIGSEPAFNIVKLLLRAGANPNIKNFDGNTALIFAARMKFTNIVELLINAHADPNIQIETLTTENMWLDHPGFTPLMLALIPMSPAEGEHDIKRIIKLLLRGGADPNIQDSNGNTALMWAIRNFDEPIIKLLLRGGADPNIQNSNGDTALMWAMRYLDPDPIIKLLLRGGATDRRWSHDYAPSGRSEMCNICYRTAMQHTPPSTRSIHRDLFITPCDHSFCEDCISRWVQIKNQKRETCKCPKCKRILK